MIHPTGLGAYTLKTGAHYKHVVVLFLKHQRICLNTSVGILALCVFLNPKVINACVYCHP